MLSIKTHKFLFRELLLTILLILPVFMPVHSQEVQRIEADFSVKETLPTGKNKMTIGRVYYSLQQERLIYAIRFPDTMKMAVTDSVIYQIREGEILHQKQSARTLRFSIFSLALHGHLKYYGLQHSIYQLKSSQKQDSLVITTWQPSAALRHAPGKIELAQKNDRLFTIISYNSDGKIISKQFFENYHQHEGVEFPHRVTHIRYTAEGKDIKVTEFKNIKLNEFESDQYYHYTIPR